MLLLQLPLLLSSRWFLHLSPRDSRNRQPVCTRRRAPGSGDAPADEPVFSGRSHLRGKGKDTRDSRPPVVRVLGGKRQGQRQRRVSGSRGGETRTGGECGGGASGSIWGDVDGSGGTEVATIMPVREGGCGSRGGGRAGGGGGSRGRRAFEMRQSGKAFLRR